MKVVASHFNVLGFERSVLVLERLLLVVCGEVQSYDVVLLVVVDSLKCLPSLMGPLLQDLRLHPESSSCFPQ
jgi:hypothetical protein